MSASDKKKLRKEEKMAQLTERQKKEQAEAKKLKLYTVIFITILALVVVSVVSIMSYQYFTSPKNTTVLSVGDHDINGVTMSYYYNDVISAFYEEQYNQYGDSTDMILMLYGLDTTMPWISSTTAKR